MTRAAGRVALGSVLLLAAQPCFAADDMRGIADPRRETAAFAGASFRLELGRGNRPRPTARLQLGVTHTYRDSGSPTPAQVLRVSGLELGASGSGRPRVYLGGQDVREIEQRLGANASTGTVLLIVGGVLVVVVVVGLMSSGGQLGPCTGGPGC